MYDEESLVRKFKALGLEAARRPPFESRIAEIRQVELKKRAEGALIVKGLKSGETDT